MSSGLAGKRVVIFGGAGVLGRAICDRLIFDGIGALGVFDIAASDTEPSGGRTAVRNREGVDVRDAVSTERAVAEFVEEFGGLDCLINNVGIMTPPGKIHHTDAAALLESLTVNVVGMFNGMKAGIPYMRTQRSGSIINTASIAASTGWTHTVPYSASKAAVLQLTRTAALEYAGEGLRINSVSPGTFLSPFHAGMDDEALKALAVRHPVGRLASASEMAGAYAYLASDDSSFVTGIDFKVDGGLSAR